MRTIIYFISFLFAGSLQAQTYSEVTSDIIPSIFGAIDFADYDNDGDLDLALIGVDAAFNDVADIYQNDEGVFTPINAGINPMHMGAISWADYDSDGDYDLLCSGQDYGMNAYAIIYENDNNSFIQVEAELPGGFWNSTGWADYDNDGTVDLAYSWYTNTMAYSAVFHNENGVFVNVEELQGLTAGSMEWADYDADGDLDLLHTGTPTDFSETPLKLYQNTGGTFEDMEIEFMDCAWYNNAIWDDVDLDGDMDVLYVADDGSDYFLVYYTNDNGSFELHNTGLPGVRTSNGNISMLTGDIDNDGDMDVVMTGDNPTYSKSTKIYLNNAGTYEALTHSIPGFGSGTIELGDIDNDGDLDLLFAGYNSATNPDFGIFINEANTNTYTANEPPAAPEGLSAVVDGNSVSLSWDMATDDHTPNVSLQYNIYIGTSPGTEDIVCSQSITDPLSPHFGFHKIPKHGNCMTNLQFEMGNFPDDIYYWSVQAIDQSGQASVFAPELSFNIGNVIGIEEVKHAITFAPNPADDIIQVNGPFSSALDVIILDIMGRKVFFETGLATGSTIDVSAIPKGQYVVRAISADYVITETIIIR